MATLVTFHAHPDDESIAMGGVMAKASDEGHRVVLVVATRGEHGEVEAGFLGEGEPLWRRREQETVASAAILGAARVEFLGYVDSGMMGTPENDLPESFWQADVEEAAARLAAILTEEGADVVTIYDENGQYGHPDHIQVHRVGLRAAELAGTPRVYMNTLNRDHIRSPSRSWQPPGPTCPTTSTPPSSTRWASPGSGSRPRWTSGRGWLASGPRWRPTPARSVTPPSSWPWPRTSSNRASAGSGSSAATPPPGLVETDLFDGLLSELGGLPHGAGPGW